MLIKTTNHWHNYKNGCYIKTPTDDPRPNGTYPFGADKLPSVQAIGLGEFEPYEANWANFY